MIWITVDERLSYRTFAREVEAQGRGVNGVGVLIPGNAHKACDGANYAVAGVQLPEAAEFSTVAQYCVLALNKTALLD